ncbi:MAG: hypothetical protein IT443_09915 [Phycisphaeraceae bacterium]|nr:hypothetical protein [Phycisphaeraceae bacterium]
MGDSGLYRKAMWTVGSAVVVVGLATSAGATMLTVSQGLIGLVSTTFSEPGSLMLLLGAVMTATGRPGAFPRR